MGQYVTSSFLSKFSTKQKFICAFLAILLLAITLSLQPYFDGQRSVIESPFMSALMFHYHMLSDWLFLQLYAMGINGYDCSNLEAFSSLVGSSTFPPVARFSPPWYYLFFAPLAMLSPTAFILSTLLLSILASILIVKISCNVLGKGEPSLLLLGTATIFFPPAIQNIAAGQIGFLLALFMILALSALKNNNYAMTGFWLALLSIKPQSSYLIVAMIVVLAIKERRYQIILSYALWLFLIISLTYIFNPELFTYWANIHTPMESQTLTLATYVRMLLLWLTQKIYNWPLYAIPIASAACVTILVVRNKLSTEKDAILLAGLSAMTAPYGWFYDLTILAPANTYILLYAVEASKKRQPLVLFIWLALNGSAFWSMNYLDYRCLFYYPLALTLLAYWINKSTNNITASTDISAPKSLNH